MAVVRGRSRPPAGPVRAAAVARAGWGCTLLFAPERVLALGTRGPAPRVAVTVARVLGARQLVQAAVTAARPTGPVTAAGLAVDGLHAGTDLGLAAVSRRWRRIALIDAVVGAGLAAAVRASGRPPKPGV